MPDRAEAAPVERLLRFDRSDIQLFAAASGDRNPLHLDEVFARETAFGTCVVHGALVAIGMLGLLPEAVLSQVRSVRLWFTGAVFPESDAHVLAAPSARRPGEWELRLTGRGRLLARALAQTEADPRAAPPTSAGAESAPRPMRTTAARVDEQTLVERAGLVVNSEYVAGPELGELARRFAITTLDHALLEGLAWASYAVGMEVPGRHGLFAGLTLSVGDGPGNAAVQRIAVRGYDPRTGRVTLDGVLRDRAGRPRCTAAIDAFALPEAGGPDPAALGLREPSPGDVQGRVAVVGASRGFGAALTLALLARGCEVHGIYSASSDRAAQLATLAGPLATRLHMHHADAREPASIRALIRGPLQGLVLAAAVPPLAMGLAGVELADYVADSLRLAAVPLEVLLPQIEPGGWTAFCSSSAVTAPPRDWPHYVTAKAALEGLASWVAATQPALGTVVLRPPAMRTALGNTPTGRVAAVAPETIAIRVADRLTSGELPTGLTVLDHHDFE